MHELNLYVDESGNLGKGMGRYFLICALEIENNLKKKITRKAARTQINFKKNKCINEEIKGYNLKHDDRIFLLNKILSEGIKVRFIVLDLNHTTMLLTKGDDKNACYNYLIQLIVKKIIEENSNLNKINLNLDNRSVKIGNRLSLKPYLYNKFVFEKLETCDTTLPIEFNVNYYNSKHCYLIQWADIVSNSIFKKYNSNDTTYYDIIKPYIVYESEFPYKKFGK